MGNGEMKVSERVLNSVNQTEMTGTGKRDKILGQIEDYDKSSFDSSSWREDWHQIIEGDDHESVCLHCSGEGHGCGCATHCGGDC